MLGVSSHAAILVFRCIAHISDLGKLARLAYRLVPQEREVSAIQADLARAPPGCGHRVFRVVRRGPPSGPAEHPP